MASDQDFIDYLLEQIQGAGAISYRKMFGEYALYCDGKVVALVCDNQLFIKPTQAGRAFIGDVVEAPAYPGARPAFLIEEKIEDGDWISELVKITARELPLPRPKKKRKAKSKKKTGKKS
jgi:TfoX/Sxy family transcriptional regulator of competence genes